MKHTAKLLTFGKGGHTLHLSGKARSNGYAHPGDFCTPYHWWADAPGKLITHWDNYDVPECGIPVVDTNKAVETAQGYAWVFKGPLVDVDLAEVETNELPEPSSIMQLAMAGNEYGQLLAIHKSTKTKYQRGALDSVSISEFVAGWRDHGARIGRFYVKDGSGVLEWE